MKSSILTPVLIFGMTLMLGSCADLAPDSMFVVNLEEEEFNCYIIEKTAPSGQSLTRLKIQTLDSAFCEHSDLTASVFMDENLLEIKIHDLSIEQNDCGALNFSPSRILSIGTLDEGSYPVRMQIGTNLHYEGTLSVTNDSYSLNLPAAATIEINPSTTYKIPEGAIWYRIYHLPEQDSFANACIQELDQLCTQPTLAPGFYTHFRLTDAGPKLLRDNEYPQLLYKDALMIINPQTSDLKQITEIMQRYRNEAGPQFIIQAESWKTDLIDIR